MGQHIKVKVLVEDEDAAGREAY
jgi:hypothetical protein